MKVIKEKQKGISIIICCYNSALRLPETIKHIAKQQGVNEIPFEVLIINNASSDNTFDVAVSECKKYFINISYNVIQEDEPGLASARKRGLLESKYEYQLFCDDDNWLAPDYVRIAFNKITSDPKIGVLGGDSIGAYETPPPAWFLKVLSVFAIGKQADASDDLTFKSGWVRGAGFIIPYSIFEQLEQKRITFFLSGRKGSKLSSGEDKELCFAIRSLGYKIVYDDGLKLQHFMPSERFKYTKLLSMAYYSGKSAYIDDLYNDNLITKSFSLYWIKTVAVNLGKLALAIVLKPFGQFDLLANPIRNDQRYNFSLGYLSTLFDIRYCLTTLKIFKQDYNII